MIKIDMKMPKSCDTCPLAYDYDWYKYCPFRLICASEYTKSRHPDCPLVEVKEEEE